jgi:hypothetical protein
MIDKLPQLSSFIDEGWPVDEDEEDWEAIVKR